MGIQNTDSQGGLHTGSVQGAKGGLSPKQAIADRYSRDLSGKNGSLAQFEAFDELIQNALAEKFAAVTFSSGDGTQIFGTDGHFAVVTPPRSGIARSVPGRVARTVVKPWDLVIDDAEAGEVSLNLGTIIKKASNLEEGFTIGGTNSFTPSPGHLIWLKIENMTSPTVELDSGSSWTDYPSAVEISGSEDTAAFDAYYYPLYHFSGTEDDGYTGVNEALFYKKLVPDCHFLLVRTVFQDDATTDRPVTSPILIPYHGVVPS